MFAAGRGQQQANAAIQPAAQQVAGKAKLTAPYHRVNAEADGP